MGFGVVLRQWVVALHRWALACFMLHPLPPDLLADFSMQQGDLAVSVIFTIYMYIKSMLVCLECYLMGIFMGAI
jgi:hypothetical protein